MYSNSLHLNYQLKDYKLSSQQMLTQKHISHIKIPHKFYKISRKNLIWQVSPSHPNLSLTMPTEIIKWQRYSDI